MNEMTTKLRCHQVTATTRHVPDPSAPNGRRELPGKRVALVPPTDIREDARVVGATPHQRIDLIVPVHFDMEVGRDYVMTLKPVITADDQAEEAALDASTQS